MARLLVLLAEEQERAAAKLERQTDKLIQLTWGLVGLTITLLAVALVQTKIMFKEENAARAQQIQAGESHKTPSTNK